MKYQHYKKQGENYVLIFNEKPCETKIRKLLFYSVSLLTVVLISFLTYIMLYPLEVQSFKQTLVFLTVLTPLVSVFFVLNQPTRIEICPDVDKFFIKVRIRTACFRFAHFQYFKKEGQKLHVCFQDENKKLVHILLGEGADDFLQSLQKETLSLLQS